MEYQTNYQLIPGWIISLLTFPGVMLHELSHWLFCDLFNVKVLEVKFFSLRRSNLGLLSSSPVGWVIHEKPKKFWQSFFISISPFLINSIFAIIIFMIALRLESSSNIGFIFCMWLGISSAMNAFPSSGDAKVLYSEGKFELKNKNYLVLLVFPLVLVIYLANILRIVWFDLIYTVLLVQFVKNFIIF